MFPTMTLHRQTAAHFLLRSLSIRVYPHNKQLKMYFASTEKSERFGWSKRKPILSTDRISLLIIRLHRKLKKRNLKFTTATEQARNEPSWAIKVVKFCLLSEKGTKTSVTRMPISIFRNTLNTSSSTLVFNNLKPSINLSSKPLWVRYLLSLLIKHLKLFSSNLRWSPN